MKTVSVIVTVYNKERFIEETLKSVLTQELPQDVGLELIVVDDGSRDSSLKLVEDVVKDYRGGLASIVVRKQENKGHSAARNLGFSISSGDLIFFLDGDDIFLHKDSLARMVKLKEKKEADVLVCGLQVIDENSRTFGRILPPEVSEAVFEAVASCYFPECGSTILTDRRTIEEQRERDGFVFDPHWRARVEDWYWFTRLCWSKRVATLRDSLIGYRKIISGEGQASIPYVRLLSITEDVGHRRYLDFLRRLGFSENFILLVNEVTLARNVIWMLRLSRMKNERGGFFWFSILKGLYRAGVRPYVRYPYLFRALCSALVGSDVPARKSSFKRVTLHEFKRATKAITQAQIREASLAGQKVAERKVIPVDLARRCAKGLEPRTEQKVA